MRCKMPQWMIAFAIGPLVVLMSSTAFATEYFIAPNGSDSNSGTSQSRPFQTFNKAVGKLNPGDTLTLLDGTYTKGQTGYFFARCNRNAKNGRADARITVRAKNERRAYIKGDGTDHPMRLLDCSYWNIVGIRASDANHKGGSTAVLQIRRSDHIFLRRLLMHHDNRYENTSLVGVGQSHHVVAEELELYDFHRHAFSAHQSDTVTLRRSFIHARGASDINGGWGSHSCCTDGGDEAVSFYYTSNSIVENTVMSDSEGLSVISGRNTALDNPGGRNNKLLGSISYKDLRASFFQSRIKESYSKSARNMLVQDMLVVGTKRESMTPRGVQDFVVDGATFYEMKTTPLHFLAAPGGPVNYGKHYFPGCEYWTCKNEIRNALFLDNAYPTIDQSLPSNAGNLQWYAEYSNAFSSSAPNKGFNVGENVGDGGGKFRNSQQTRPAEMGLGQGQCLVFVPDGSNMKGAGKDGSDIGANILYRYEDGQLTSEPLWDPQTGEFPCGAVISGVNDVPGESCFDIHKQLNVNHNGCQLPYGEELEPPEDVVLTSERASGAVTIDGDLSESVYATNLTFEDARGSSDNTARVWSGWDDEWLYLGVEIDDASIEVGGDVSPWLQDGVELFIDPNRDRSQVPTPDDLKLLTLADGTTDLATAPEGQWRSITHNANIKRAVVDTGSGFRVEVAIGWNNMGLTPSAGDRLGLLVVDNDRDNGQTARYSTNGAEPFSNPSVWGSLELLAGEDVGNTDTGTSADAGTEDTGRIQDDTGAETPPDTGLQPDSSSEDNDNDDYYVDIRGESTCSSTGGQSVPAAALVVAMLGLLGLTRRRRG